MLVLGYLHGDDAVTDAFQLDGDAGDEDRDNGDELERLKRIYGLKAVSDVFPGARPKLPEKDPRIVPRKEPSKPKRAPVSMDPVITSDPLPITVIQGGEAATVEGGQVAGVALNAIYAAASQGRPVPAAPVPIIQPIDPEPAVADKTQP